MYQIIQPDRKQTYNKEIITGDPEIRIFLAGSIEMGKAKNWQAGIAKQLTKNVNQELAAAHKAVMPTLIFYNPRREENFTPEMEVKQIMWEQERLEKADYIFMYIQADTKSPISLLEFGEFMRTGKLFLSCDSTFYRYQNLKITAKHVGQAKHLFATTDECCHALAQEIATNVHA